MKEPTHDDQWECPTCVGLESSESENEEDSENEDGWGGGGIGVRAKARLWRMTWRSLMQLESIDDGDRPHGEPHSADKGFYIDESPFFFVSECTVASTVQHVVVGAVLLFVNKLAASNMLYFCFYLAWFLYYRNTIDKSRQV